MGCIAEIHKRATAVEPWHFLSDKELEDLPETYLRYIASIGKISQARLERALNAKKETE
jgi:hypothetical protein